MRAALTLLNDEEAEFEPTKVLVISSSILAGVLCLLYLQVLSILPANWPIESLRRFLTHSLRRSMHSHRMNDIERHLSKQQNHLVKTVAAQQTFVKVLLTDQRLVNCGVLWSAPVYRRQDSRRDI